MAYDKPWDEDFQDVPGTPGRGDQFSLGFNLQLVTFRQQC